MSSFFDNLKQEIVIAATALAGGWTKSKFGIKLSLMLPEGAEKPHESVMKVMHDESHDLMRSIISAYEAATVGLDPANKESTEKQRVLFKSLFRAMFAAEDMPNPYSNDKAFLALNPAMRVLSPIGWTSVHWRKRVLELNFDKSVVAVTDIENAMNFLGLSKNTFNTSLAHAWSYGEAKKIIDAVELFSVIRRTKSKCVMIYERYVGGGGGYKSYSDVMVAAADWMNDIYKSPGSTFHWCNIDFDPISEFALQEYSTMNTQAIVDGASIEYHVKRLPDDIKVIDKKDEVQ